MYHQYYIWTINISDLLAFCLFEISVNIVHCCKVFFRKLASRDPQTYCHFVLGYSPVLLDKMIFSNPKPSNVKYFTEMCKIEREMYEKYQK